MMLGSLKQYVEEKHVGGSLRERLEALGVDEQEALCAILALSPSANTLQELLRLSVEIAARDGVSLHSVLSSEELLAILEREGVNRKEKQKLLRALLEETRFPEMKKIRDSLSAHQAQLRKECGLRLSLPEDLEGDSVSLEISARSPKDLEQLAARIKQLAKHPSTKAVFDILGGHSS